VQRMPRVGMVGRPVVHRVRARPPGLRVCARRPRPSCVCPPPPAFVCVPADFVRRYMDIENITLSVKPGASMGLMPPAMPPPPPLALPPPPPPLLSDVAAAGLGVGVLIIIIVAALLLCCRSRQRSSHRTEPLLGNQESQPEGQ
jgi:hypothetical protein